LQYERGPKNKGCNMPPVLCVSEKQAGRNSALLKMSEKRPVEKNAGRPDPLEVLRKNPGALLTDERLDIWPAPPIEAICEPSTEASVAAVVNARLREIKEKGTAWR